MSKKNKNTVNVEENVVEEGVETPVEKKESWFKRATNKGKEFTNKPTVQKVGKVVGGIFKLGLAVGAGYLIGSRRVGSDSIDLIDDAEPETLDEVESSDLD